MLAALLCNLAAPAAPAAAARRFGGGPWWRRYGYDDAYDAIRAAALDADEALERAVDLIAADPSLDYDSAMERARVPRRREYRAIWREEIARRLCNREDNDVIALFLLS